MADLVRSVQIPPTLPTISQEGGVALATTNPCPAHRPSGLVAGEAITAGQACYIKASGGKSKVFLCDGTAADAKSQCRGFAAQNTPIGKGVTLLNGVHIGGYAGLTPGANFYLSTTPGELSDAPTTGSQIPVAWAWDDTIIHVHAGGGGGSNLEEAALLGAIPVAHTTLPAGTDTTAVPGTFADLPAVVTYLTTLRANIEARLDRVDAEAALISTDLKTAKIFS